MDVGAILLLGKLLEVKNYILVNKKDIRILKESI